AHQHGFKAAEIQPIPARVTDQSRFGGNQNQKTGRYLVQGGIEIRSKNVERVRQASQMTGDLIKQGIVLNLEPEGAAANPAYYFTHLDSIRPAMLAAATKSARAVAQQFANDSGSRLGPIRRANQGVFQILPRDGSGSQNSYLEPRSIEKTIRLVSTIDYFLEN
ncbi:MAG: SIMPL domain-containing protein, partial [Candidatus Binataceae bacterium]